MRERLHGDDFEPEIRVTVDEQKIVVVDNGIGMTAEERRNQLLVCGKEQQKHRRRSSGRCGGHVWHWGDVQLRSRL